MKDLIVFNVLLIIAVAGVVTALGKLCKSNTSKHLALIILPILTVLCHYSSLIYHHFTDNTAMIFLQGNPNLILPIYPCNVVMWLSLLFGVLRNKKSKFASFLIDFLFWFGIISALIGMFVNVDYFREPSLLNYDVTKGIVAHAMMLLNVLALPVFGLVKIRLERNLLNIVISIVMMYLVGLYCNLIFTVISSPETAYNVNSMFISHSPFPDVEFLTYPTVALAALCLYFVLFAICEFFAYGKGARWYSRIKKF